jgi:ribosome biogenesis GTPase A
MVRVRYSFGSRHTGRIANIKKQRGKYPDVMKEVVRISDIVLEILDARFIEETRNLEVEKDILEKGKKLVYVLNKSDLVDVKELEKALPKWMKPYVFVSATERIGLKDIKARIKMESKRILSARNAVEQRVKEKQANGSKEKMLIADLISKKRIHVGVIGYPNTGKSSVINFISHRGAAKTSKQAGWTKGMQKIRMSEDILILDTPGVIPASLYSSESNSFAKDVKVGGRTYSNVKNPEDVVYYLISAPEPKDENNLTEKEKILADEAERNSRAIRKFYDIKSDGDMNDLIEELGEKKRFLGKGGKVDVDRTARIILRDWQEGKIKV